MAYHTIVEDVAGEQVTIAIEVDQAPKKAEKA